MIAKLKGVLDDFGADWAVIDVGGVGYLVFCSRRTLSVLGAQGDAVTVFVETHVREDHIHLYGFADAAEREWFRLLLTVQGVGAKVALAILSVLDTVELAQTIAAEDYKPLARANRRRAAHRQADRDGAEGARAPHDAGGVGDRGRSGRRRASGVRGRQRR